MLILSPEACPLTRGLEEDGGHTVLVSMKVTLESGQGLESHGSGAGALHDQLQDGVAPGVGKPSCGDPWAAALGLSGKPPIRVAQLDLLVRQNVPLATVQYIRRSNLKRRKGKEEEESGFCWISQAAYFSTCSMEKS